MGITRVILSSDNNEQYLQFWDTVSEAWNKFVGIRPVLFVISDKDLNLSTENGDVVYQKPVSGVPTAQQAQIIRFFGATKYPNERCLISDLDMLPLQSEYFKNPAKQLDKDTILFYSADAYLPGNPAYPAFPMCYMSATGETFEQILGANLASFSSEVVNWMTRSYGWYTDEKVFFEKWYQWSEKEKRTAVLNRGFNRGPAITMRRVDRSENSFYDESILSSGGYIDYHMPRPFSKNSNKILEIFKIARENSYGAEK